MWKIYVTTNLVIYVLFAFNTLNMNPLSWSDLARLVYTLISFIVNCVLTAFWLDMEQKVSQTAPEKDSC